MENLEVNSFSILNVSCNNNKSIIRLLVEIYAMPNLKMNLKFDIEVCVCLVLVLPVTLDFRTIYLYIYHILLAPQVLFKNLGVDLKDVTPTSLLKDRVRQIEENPDFSNKDTGVSQQQMVGG